MLKPYHKAELTFDIIKEIGQDGRNSRTFVVRDHQLNAEIVTKQIRKANLNSPAEFFAEVTSSLRHRTSSRSTGTLRLFR